MRVEARSFLLSLLACAALCGCRTTGDPTQGGLFGWSEEKARERQAEREATLSREEQTAQRQEESEAGLRREMRLEAGDLDEQRREISQLLANAEALERESPTEATASRARRLRREIDAVRQDEAVPVEERWSLLRRYSAEVDLMRAEVSGQDRPSIQKKATTGED
jgi:hypothetical protein